MARYAELADGTRLEFPDETPDDVIERVARQMAVGNQPTEPQNAPTGNFAENALAGVGQAFVNLGAGAQQRAVDLGVKLGLASPETAQRLQAEEAERRRLDAPLNRTWGGRVGNFAGNVAAIGPAMLIPGANTVLGAGAVGALSGALQPTTSDESIGRNVMLGAAGGSGGAAAGKVLGAALRARTPLPDVTAAAKKFDIPILASQATGSKPLQVMESVLGNLPGSSGRVAQARGAQQAAFNRAVLKTAGESADSATPEVMSRIGTRLSKEFQRVPGSQTVKLDDRLLSDLASVETRYARNLTPDQRGIVAQYLDDILTHGENIPGNAYQAWRSRISARASSTGDSELKTALRGIYKALDDAFDRSATPEAVRAMKAARSQYKAFKAIQPIAEKGSDIAPSALRAQVAKSTPDFAMGGGGELGELARLGMSLRDPIPNSGTAQRLFWQGLLTGGAGATALASPTLAGIGLATPYVASRALLSGPGQRYLTNGLFHQVTPEVEAALMRSGGLLGLGAAPNRGN